MKKYLIIALLVGCTVPVMIAQQINKNQTKRETSTVKVESYTQRRADLLKQELNLTDAQVKQVKAIYEKNAPIRLGIQSKEGINITEMNRKENEEILKVLTPQQREQYNQKMQQHELERKKIQDQRGMRTRETVDEPRPELKKDLEKTK